MNLIAHTNRDDRDPFQGTMGSKTIKVDWVIIAKANGVSDFVYWIEISYSDGFASI